MPTLCNSKLSDHPAITKYLLDKGADPSAGNNKGLTCVHLAVLRGRVACVRHILARQPPVNVNQSVRNLKYVIEKYHQPPVVVNHSVCCIV